MFLYLDVVCCCIAVYCRDVSLPVPPETATGRKGGRGGRSQGPDIAQGISEAGGGVRASEAGKTGRGGRGGRSGKRKRSSMFRATFFATPFHCR